MATRYITAKTTARWVALCLVIASTWACTPKRPGTDPGAIANLSDLSIPGYIRLQEDMANLDTAALRGRRIVLDPGHGGWFRGAVGPGNQHEADANLGVGLYLRGLLEWAGSTVYMTRTSDHDFLSPADSTLASDLAFRVSFTDSLQPDVFISIHHNSTASADPAINETQTYYPLGDGGPSLDLARAIHRHLVINLNISPAKIMPGNFHVLRHATVPAVLGEPAMISNPVMAGRLSHASSLKLEAEAYFLGILDYFANGTPTFTAASVSQEGFSVRGDTITCPPDSDFLTIQWSFENKPSEPGPNPKSFQLLAGDDEVPFSVAPNGATVTWRGKTPPHGPLVLALRGKNLAGRSTPTRLTRIEPVTPHAVMRTVFPENPANPGPRLSLLHRQRMNDHPNDRTSGEVAVLETEGWSLIPSTGEAAESPLPAGLRWHLLTGSGLGETETFSWQERLPLIAANGPDWTRNYQIPAAVLPIIGPESSPVWIEIPGFIPLIDPDPSSSGSGGTLAAAGRHWPLMPLVPQLQGETIVLDAAGGGTKNQGQGPLGTRGSDLNLETVRHLKTLLVGAGAKVVLTRKEEADPRAENKVKLANDAGAGFFLTISRSAGSTPGITIHHHPQSKVGKAWATSIGKFMGPMLDKKETLTVTQDWAYLLRHTACPAVSVNLPIPQTIPQETRLRSSNWAQTEARALFLALVQQVAPDAGPMNKFSPETIIQSLPEHAFALEDIRWVLVDGNFPWYPPLPSFFSNSQKPAQSLDLWVTPGLPNLIPIHTLELHTPDGWQLWVWESGTPPSAAKLLLAGK